MAKFIRYALATVCFAASVGCLALWWRSMTSVDELQIRVSAFRPERVVAGHYAGYAMLGIHSRKTGVAGQTISFVSEPLEPAYAGEFIAVVASKDRFGAIGDAIYFPLWYPALLFALAGIAAIRFRRQFSLRSALVATTATAALIAMAVIL